MQTTELREYRLIHSGTIWEYVRAASDDEAIHEAGEIAEREGVGFAVIDSDGEKVATVIPGRGF